MKISLDDEAQITRIAKQLLTTPPKPRKPMAGERNNPGAKSAAARTNKEAAPKKCLK
jgi:hypothetical protein